MSVAVVIIAAGRGAHLARLLAGLVAQTRRADEIVVVRMRPGDPDAGAPGIEVRTIDLPSSDDRTASGTGTADALALGAARNLGARSTTATDVVFLDLDCIPGSDTVARYADVLADHPSALACGPVRYLRPDWLSSVADGSTLATVSDAPAARPVPAGEAVIVDDRHELFWSLTFGVRRPTWERLGGFDESFVGYGAEDTDLGLRARAAGIPLAWFGGGTTFHQWHPPTRLDPQRTLEIVANARRFHARWDAWPMTGWLRELTDLGLIDFDAATDRLEVTAP